MFDKSKLSPELVAKQKEKSTYDSACMSVCNYNSEGLCQTCLMYQAEKQQWKVADLKAKEKIAAIVKQRQAKKSN